MSWVINILVFISVCLCFARETFTFHLYARPHSCHDVQLPDQRPVLVLSNGMEVVCDTTTDGGGWIIFQRRNSSDVDFYQPWLDYKYGFGDVYGDFWFGLEKIFQLTQKQRYEMRIDIEYNGEMYYAKYDSFFLMAEKEHYQLRVKGHSGTVQDSLTSNHNKMSFSTYDKDHDRNNSENCAKVFHGAWWYRECDHLGSNLNGKWGSIETFKGLNWHTLTYLNSSVTFSEMKMRPISHGLQYMEDEDYDYFTAHFHNGTAHFHDHDRKKRDAERTQRETMRPEDTMREDTKQEADTVTVEEMFVAPNQSENSELLLDDPT